MLPFDLFKHSTMSPLAQQVYELGVCAKCHERTLRFIHAGAGMRFFQCTACKVIAVLDDKGEDLAQ
jgi:hypothetical protein